MLTSNLDISSNSSEAKIVDNFAPLTASTRTDYQILHDFKGETLTLNQNILLHIWQIHRVPHIWWRPGWWHSRDLPPWPGLPLQPPQAPGPEVRPLTGAVRQDLWRGQDEWNQQKLSSLEWQQMGVQWEDSHGEEKVSLLLEDLYQHHHTLRRSLQCQHCGNCGVSE